MGGFNGLDTLNGSPTTSVNRPGYSEYQPQFYGDLSGGYLSPGVGALATPQAYIGANNSNQSPLSPNSMHHAAAVAVAHHHYAAAAAAYSFSNYAQVANSSSI